MSNFRGWIRWLPAAAMVPALTGCGMLRGAATSALAPMASQMSASLQEQTDPDLVRDGAPALILVLDGFAASAPDNPEVLLAAANARVGYAAAFIDRGEAVRARDLYARARDYGIAALSRNARFRAAVSGPVDAFETSLAGFDRADVPALYTTAMAWMGWILNSGGAMEAVAQINRPVAMMRRVMALDPSHERGGPHLFFGIYYAVQPRGGGGDLAASKRHFEQAMAAAGDKALLPRVALAEFYARYALDQELFEKTLRAVVGSRDADDPPGLQLMNAVARRRAKALLPMAEEWF
jgi:hypothetical protein